jgi:hypothetical protein
MIQRIQSVYLLVSAIVLLLTFFFPFAIFGNTDIGNYSLLGICSVSNFGNLKIEFGFLYYFLSVFTAVLTSISIATIFLFKYRKMQINLTQLNLILHALFYVLVFYIINNTLIINNEILATPKYKFTFYSPIVSFVLVFLALKAIKKDDDLVKSVDRIR